MSEMVDTGGFFAVEINKMNKNLKIMLIMGERVLYRGETKPKDGVKK
jgi:hypothetical protein